MLQFNYNDIIKISKNGIIFKTLKDEMQIEFLECCHNFALENSQGHSKCVATRDISIPSFIFYSNPKVEVVFAKHNLFNTIFNKQNNKEFNELQKCIKQFGYTTYDLS